jgi:uncharacterized RDD family membrane protein YckC
MSFHSSAVTLSGAEVPIVLLVPATFWQRLAAALIDFVLTGLVVVSLGKLCATSKPLADVFLVPLTLFAFVYYSVGHALYGRTVGKHLLKIRVVRLDGTRIGWNEAVRRSSIDGLFGVVWLIGLEAAPTRRSANLNAPGVVSCSAAKAEEIAGVAIRRKALQIVSNVGGA